MYLLVSLNLFPLWCCETDSIRDGGAPLEKPISLLNMGHCFQVPTHSATTIFHITISTTYKRHFLISLWERVPLETETHLSLSVFLWIILKSLFQCDATICMLDGMLISKAVLFIDMDGLFVCTGAWGEAALTFGILVLLSCMECMIYMCTPLYLAEHERCIGKEKLQRRKENKWLNPEALSLHLWLQCYLLPKQTGTG